MNRLIQSISLGHSIAFVLISILTLIAIGAKTEIPKRINYAIDYELGIAHQCDGTDYSYKVLQCKYNYTDLLNR